MISENWSCHKSFVTVFSLFCEFELLFVAYLELFLVLNLSHSKMVWIRAQKASRITFFVPWNVVDYGSMWMLSNLSFWIMRNYLQIWKFETVNRKFHTFVSLITKHFMKTFQKYESIKIFKLWLQVFGMGSLHCFCRSLGFHPEIPRIYS